MPDKTPGVVVCPFDHHDDSQDADDFFATYETLREHPVTYSDHHGGFWILSRYDDVRTALRDHATFSSAGGCFLPDLGYRSLGLEQDPPDHAPFRKLYARMVGRPAVEQHETQLREMIKRVVGEFVDSGGGDARDGLSERFPVEAVALMFDVSPAAAARIRELTTEAWKRMSTDANALAPLAEMLLHEVDEHLARGASDFLTELATAEVDGRAITREEVGNLLIAAVVAGHETTMNASTNVIVQLAADPALQRRLRDDPPAIPSVVDEALRHRAPVHLFFRTVTRDVDIADTHMRAGDKVALVYASANRDPATYDDPSAFRPEREAPGHLAFGWGIHRCVGAFMAQTELRILVEEMLRCGTIELSGAPVQGTLQGGHHVGFKKVPVQFTSGKPAIT